MNLHSNKKRPASDHIVVSAAAIGGLSLVLVIGLEMIGFLDSVNRWIGGALSRGGLETFPNRLPAWCPWLAAAVFPFALAFAMLASPGHVRRGILWLTVVVLLGTWGPVLSLAAYAPDIAGPWVATFWAGFCAMVYSFRHHAGKQPSNEKPG